MDDEALRDRILQNIDRHSGGTKFLTLLTEVMMRDNGDNFADRVEKVIRKMPELEILEYAVPVKGRKGVRVRMFVYRPLERLGG